MKVKAPDLMVTPPPVVPPPPTSLPVKADPGLPQLDAARVCAALGSPVRWRAFELLAGGAFLTASQVAKALGRDFDGVSKHLRLMRSAGVIASKPASQDRRFEFYFVPPAYRPVPGVVDYGVCVLRVPVPEAAPE